MFHQKRGRKKFRLSPLSVGSDQRYIIFHNELTDGVGLREVHVEGDGGAADEVGRVHQHDVAAALGDQPRHRLELRHVARQQVLFSAQLE